MQLMVKKIYIAFFLILFIPLCTANEIFISLKKNKVNVRYGPSFDSDIKYVYNKIRALQYPYPNAFIQFTDGSKLYLKKSSFSKGKSYCNFLGWR